MYEHKRVVVDIIFVVFPLPETAIFSGVYCSLTYISPFHMRLILIRSLWHTMIK